MPSNSNKSPRSNEFAEKRTNIEPCKLAHSTFFDTVGVLWAHSYKDVSWEIESFVRVYDIKNIYDFWSIFNNIDSVQCGSHLFLMRQGIAPRWEDPNNAGIWSFKIPKKFANWAFTELLVALVGNKLTNKPEFAEHISGISFTLKENQSVVIKLWASPYTVKLFEEMGDKINEYFLATVSAHLNPQKAIYMVNR